MADQVDAHPQLQEDDSDSTEPEHRFSEPWEPRVLNDIIEWSKMDDELRLAHEKKVAESQKPSMWEYNCKGGVPTELANLDPSTFLTSHQGRILCFLTKDILIRICSMLSPGDFLRLSLTCRFLHWRMFTFCTCYAPYTVEMKISDLAVEDIWHIYFNFEKMVDGYELKGERSLSTFQPFCLRKPFFFDTLELTLTLPYYRKKYYDMCLPNIMAVRSRARNLDLIIRNNTFDAFYLKSAKVVDYSDTNNFFMIINPTYYYRITCIYREDECHDFVDNKDIYVNCPYARQMNRIRLENTTRLLKNVPIFQNQIGFYCRPMDSAIIATLKDFLTGSNNLILHKYCEIEENDGRFPLLEYLFQEFGQFEEFFYANSYLNWYWDTFFNCHHIWKKIVTTENGEQIRIEIDIVCHKKRRHF